MKDDKIVVSVKHKTLRIICFAISVVVGIGAFSYAIWKITNKEPDYYEIKADPDEAVPLYANGIKLTCYFGGQSGDIKTGMAEARTAYSNSLKWIYQLLDADQTHEGFINIATINQSLGQDIKLPKELFAILKDAYERTCEQNGYNMFAGALYEEWNSILVLQEPGEYDPLINESESERIKRIAEATADLSNFSFDIIDIETHTVRISVSDKYMQLIKELELSGTIVDLNVLKEAYMLEYIVPQLNRAGYTRGYITTESGLSYALKENTDGHYFLYGTDNGRIELAASLPMCGGSACCMFRAFRMSEGELGYYTIEKNGAARLRHPHFSAITGEEYDTFMSSCVISYDGDIVDACAKSMALYAYANEDDAAAIIKANGSGSTVIAYTTQLGPKKVYVAADDAESIVPAEDNGYSIKVLSRD